MERILLELECRYYEGDQWEFILEMEAVARGQGRLNSKVRIWFYSVDTDGFELLEIIVRVS